MGRRRRPKEQGQLTNNVDVAEGDLWTNKYIDVNALHSDRSEGR
jgi:hypothetical protein